MAVTVLLLLPPLPVTKADCISFFPMSRISFIRGYFSIQSPTVSVCL